MDVYTLRAALSRYTITYACTWSMYLNTVAVCANGMY